MHIRKWITLLCILMALCIPTQASMPKIIADGWEYDGIVIKIKDRVYVSLREFATVMDNAVVSWNAETMTSTVKTDSLTLQAWENGDYIIANNRYLWCEYGTFTYNGVMMVPLNIAAKAFGFDHSWADNTTYLTRKRGAIVPGDQYYDKSDVWWLAKIIHAEAQGEPFTGKIAVGEVVLNRVADADFPDTIYDVIFDNKNGVQFTPTVNGAIEADPGRDSLIAAKLVLDGARMGKYLLYFLNPDIATSFWIPQNRVYCMTIGTHDFYA